MCTPFNGLPDLVGSQGPNHPIVDYPSAGHPSKKRGVQYGTIHSGYQGRRQNVLQQQVARLTHHVHILEMNGDSCRLKSSLQDAGPQSPDYSEDV